MGPPIDLLLWRENSHLFALAATLHPSQERNNCYRKQHGWLREKVVNCNGNSWRRNIGWGMRVATRSCQKLCWCLEPNATFTHRLSVERLSIDRCLAGPIPSVSAKNMFITFQASCKVSRHPALEKESKNDSQKNHHLLLRDRVNAVIVEAIPMNSQMLVACNAESSPMNSSMFDCTIFAGLFV